MDHKHTKNAATQRGLRLIALFEGVKGVAAITASLGLLSLAHQDLRQLAYALIGHFHIDPEAHFPKLFLDYAQLLENENLRSVVLLAWGYAAIRLAEAYGLWKDKAWAEWLAALSGGVYVPLEIRHLAQHTTTINAAVLAANIAVVLYMVLRLWRRRTARASR